MAIPDRTHAQIRHAIAKYDASGADYNWKANKFALVHEGRYYPPKVIVSLATRLPVTGFSGGDGGGAANPYLRKRGFTVVSIADLPGDGTPGPAAGK